MNSLNNSLVDAGAGTATIQAEREEEVRTDTSGAGRVSAGILAIVVALELTDGGDVVFGVEDAELL